MTDGEMEILIVLKHLEMVPPHSA